MWETKDKGFTTPLSILGWIYAIVYIFAGFEPPPTPTQEQLFHPWTQFLLEALIVVLTSSKLNWRFW